VADEQAKPTSEYPSATPAGYDWSSPAGKHGRELEGLSNPSAMEGSS